MLAVLLLAAHPFADTCSPFLYDHPRPARIIIIRHGQSHGNLDEKTYVNTPDHRIPLSDTGVLQARKSGKELREIIQDENVFFYTSPYLRTRQTMQALKSVFDEKQVLGEKEEPRLAEQQFGNFQRLEDIRKAKKDRLRFGRFFYRFPNGESGLDVYSRMSSFMNTLFKDVQARQDGFNDLDRFNIIIVTHGLSLRLFLMRWFHLTVEGFEQLWNPGNAGYVIMEPNVNAHAGSSIYTNLGAGSGAGPIPHAGGAEKGKGTHSGIQCIPSVAGTFENWNILDTGSSNAAIRMGLVHRIAEAVMNITLPFIHEDHKFSPRTSKSEL